MVEHPEDDRMECTNEIRPGKICGAHVAAGKNWCPVCGEPTRTRRLNTTFVISNEPREPRSWSDMPSARGVH